MWRAGDDEDHEGQQFLLLTSRNRIQTPNSVLDLRNFLPSSPPTNDKKRVSVAMRFQWAFLQLLHYAEFEELSARDLMLTSSLKTDYLLTLPIYVDWKKASESYAIISAFKDVLQTEEVHDWTKRLKLWLKELRLFQHSFQQEDMSSDDVLGVDELSDKELPIWFAAQRAVSCYEGLLSPIGPRERLLRRLFTWSGLISPTPEKTFEPDGDSNASEPYTSKIVHLPIFLSRISVSDIWRPATRKYCGNDIWKMLKTSTSILLSQSILQEPAFQELILLYTVVVDEKDTGQRVDVPSLQLKIYEQIPIPELPDIFPHKKLSFRIIDTVRLDVATILGLLAYFINHKFVNVLTSPILLLQLLVNKALYEKILASGFGSIHFLLDALEQQYKEDILAYLVLLKMEKSKITCCRDVADKCERFIYDAFRVKVQMPIDKAISTFLRLGLATETHIHGRTRLQAIPCPEAYENLKQRWNSLLGFG
ncbi:hypothetical protein UlMin_026820 [Ulmus minor]